MNIQENISLSPFTTFRVGGPARFFVVAKTIEDVQSACAWAKEKSVPIFVLGGGANILVADQGFSGLVIKMELGAWSIEGEIVRAESGVSTALLASECARAGLYGLAWAVGVPGTIGGAVRGNAGASGGEMKDVIDSVKVLSANAIGQQEILDFRFQISDLSNAECAFGYRHSIFKERPELIVLSVTFQLEKGDANEEIAKMKEALGYRNQTQPKEWPNSGCVFKNVELTTASPHTEVEPPLWRINLGTGDRSRIHPATQSTVDALRAKGVPEEFIAKGRISAGWLIEHSGCSGLAVGGARVSDRHCNFLQNFGGGTAEDIRSLISLIKEKVYTHFGVSLEEEVQCVGFDDL